MNTLLFLSQVFIDEDDDGEDKLHLEVFRDPIRIYNNFMKVI